jgi:hypothetical protein
LRQAAGQRIHLRHAGRTDLWSVHPEYEIPAQCHGAHIRFFFALTLILQDGGTAVKVGGTGIKKSTIAGAFLRWCEGAGD